MVREFDTTGAEVWRMEDDDIRPLGMGLARATVSLLEWRSEDGWGGRRARVEVDPTLGPGKLLIEGRITYVDGGSRALRWAVGFGAGNVQIWAKGRVVGPDGLVLASFQSAQGCSRANLGGAYETLLQDCLEAIGYEIAELVAAGQWHSTGGQWDAATFAPVHGPLKTDGTEEQPVVEALPGSEGAPPRPAVEQRLRKLEALRESGVITPEEHRTQRQRILDDL